jgi:hypothetical protein
MILTRSIWLVVIFHGLIDWSIVFDEYVPPDPNEVAWEPSMWDGLTSPLFNLGIFLFLAWLLFKIEKGTVPNWVKRLAIKWKLVEPELITAQKKRLSDTQSISSIVWSSFKQELLQVREFLSVSF